MNYLKYLPIFAFLLLGIAQASIIFDERDAAEDPLSDEHILRVKREAYKSRPRFGFNGDAPSAQEVLHRVKRANHPIFQNSHVIDRDTYKKIVDDPASSPQRAEEVLNKLNTEDKALRKAEWEKNNPGKSADFAPVVGRGKNRRMQWENANPLNQRKVQSLIATNNPQDAHFSFNKDPNRQIVDRPGVQDNVYESNRPFRILEVGRDGGKNGPVTRVEKATAPVAVALDKNKLPVHYQGVFSPADGEIAPPNSPTSQSSISRRASSPMIRDLGTTIKELRVSSNREPIGTTPRSLASSGGGGSLTGRQSPSGPTGGGGGSDKKVGGGGNVIGGSSSNMGGSGSGGATSSQIGTRATSPINIAEPKKGANSMGSSRPTPTGSDHHGSTSRMGMGGNTISSSRTGSLTETAGNTQTSSSSGNRMGGSSRGNSGRGNSRSAVNSANTLVGSRRGSIGRGSESNRMVATGGGGTTMSGSGRGSITSGTTGTTTSGRGRGSTAVQPNRNSGGNSGIGSSTSITGRGGSSIGSSSRNSVGGGIGSSSSTSGGRGGGQSRRG